MSFIPTRPLLSHKLPPSSKAWLARQFKDPIVRERLSHPAQYRSRSAFKLLELDAQWRFLKHKDVMSVVDLGAAPGGWSQVVAGKLGWTIGDVIGSRKLMENRKMKKVKYGKGKGAEDERRWGDAEEEEAEHGFGLSVVKRQQEYGSWSSPPVAPESESDPLEELGFGLGEQTSKAETPAGRGTIVAVDLLPIWPIAGVKTLQMDFLSPEADEYINALLSPESGVEGKADVILSDLAANFTGNRVHDVEASVDICHAVLKFAKRRLRKAKDIGRTRGGVLLYVSLLFYKPSLGTNIILSLKHFAHPLTQEFRNKYLHRNFHTVQYLKPESSRSESSEGYWLCMGWDPK